MTKSPIFFFNASVKQCPAQFYFMPTYQVWVCKFTFLLCVEVVQEMYYPVNYPVKTLNLLRYYLNLLRYYIMQETKSWKFFFKKSHFKCLNEVALLLKSFLSPCLHVCTHVVFWVFFFFVGLFLLLKFLCEFTEISVWELFSAHVLLPHHGLWHNFISYLREQCFIKFVVWDNIKFICQLMWTVHI